MNIHGPITLTPASQELFESLANDYHNWTGTPLITVTPAQEGNLTDLKKKGLLTTFENDGCMFADFTPRGVAFMKEIGIYI